MNWSDLKTRQLLRKLHTPAAVDEDPTASMLVAALGASSPRKAVELVVQRALRPYPAIYWTVVRRIDVEDEELEAVIADLGYSQRTIYRYRASAMRAITREIDTALRSGAPGKHAADASDVSLLALASYLRARRTHSSLRKALECFGRVLRDVPGSAAAYAGVADVHLIAADGLLCEPGAALRLSTAAVEHGLALDPNCADLHAIRAQISLISQRDVRAASASVQRALGADRRSSRACLAAGRVALATADFSGAAGHVQRGMESGDDVLALHTLLGVIYVKQGHAPAGIQELEGVLGAEPSFAHARFELARMLTGEQRYDDAYRHLAHLMAEEPRVSYSALLAYVAARRGDRRPAVELLDGSAASLLIGHLGHYLRAYAHIALGDRQTALEELRTAVDMREPWTAFMHQDDVFVDLWGEASFRRLRAA